MVSAGMVNAGGAIDFHAQSRFKKSDNIRILLGYAGNSRTYYILGLSFWRSEAVKMIQVVEVTELFALAWVRCQPPHPVCTGVNCIAQQVSIFNGFSETQIRRQKREIF